MMSKTDLLERLFDALTLLEHKLEPIPAITVKLTIPNAGGFDPVAMINLSGPAYHQRQLEAEFGLFLLDPSDNKHEVHLDLDVLNVQVGEFLLNIHCDLATIDEIQAYFDEVLALFHSIY